MAAAAIGAAPAGLERVIDDVAGDIGSGGLRDR